AKTIRRVISSATDGSATRGTSRPSAPPSSSGWIVLPSWSGNRTNAAMPIACAQNTSSTARSSECGACSMSITTNSKPAWAVSWTVSNEGILTHVPSRPCPLLRTFSATLAMPASSEPVAAEPVEQQLRDFLVVQVGERDVRVPLESGVGELEDLDLSTALVDRLGELLAQCEEIGPTLGLFEMVAPDDLDRDRRQPGEFLFGDINRAERALAQLRLHRVGEDVSRVLVGDDALDVVALEAGQQRAKTARRIGQQHRRADPVDRRGRGVGLELRVGDRGELVVPGAVGLLALIRVILRELQGGEELPKRRAETHGGGVTPV